MIYGKRNNFKRYIVTILSIALGLFCLAGCGRGQQAASSEEGLVIYYVNNEETKIVSTPYTLEADPADTDAAVGELIAAMEEIPDNIEYEAPIASDVALLDYAIEDKLVTMNFDDSYRDIDSVREVLLRAATVRTLTQLDGVDYVTFHVQGEPLSDARGNVIGYMGADTFIYNAGNEINSYEKIQLTLYFANEEGDKLSPVYRTVVYNSNISMERLVVDQLIAGPQNNIAFPTINPATQVLTVSVRDGICYVDLDSAFLTQPNAVTAEVCVYSIVNSLAELSGVNKVQILVGGEMRTDFMETMNLATVLERNLDIVE